MNNNVNLKYIKIEIKITKNKYKTIKYTIN